MTACSSDVGPYRMCRGSRYDKAWPMPRPRMTSDREERGMISLEAEITSLLRTPMSPTIVIG